MTVNPHLVQHLLTDAVLTEPDRPSWLPIEDLPAPGWHLYRSGDFPFVTDPALRGGTDEHTS